MWKFISQKLCCNGRKIAMMMLLGATLSHAMEVPIVEVPVENRILNSTNCFGEGFLYPCVEDEQEYERIKINSVYFPFARGTTYDQLFDKGVENCIRYKAAQESGFLDVVSKSPPEISLPSDFLLWSEQEKFLKEMNLNKLMNFWPGIKIGKDNEGRSFSYSHYKSYIFHSKQFRTIYKQLPCLTGSDQLDESFIISPVEDQKILFDSMKFNLKKFHYQFSFYHIYDLPRKRQYIFWIEAYNPRFPSDCVLDQITIRGIQNFYYSTILDVIKDITYRRRLLNDIGNKTETFQESNEIFLEMPEEIPLEMGEVIIETIKNSNFSGADDTPISSDLIIKESFPKSRKRSLSNYVTRAAAAKFKPKVKPLNLPEIKYNSLSTPNSPTAPLIDYQTGLTPKSAPTSHNKRLSDTRISMSNSEFSKMVNNSGGSEEYQKTLEDLELLEQQRELIDKQSELLDKQKDNLIQKLRTHENSLGTTNSTPRSPVFRSSSPGNLSPGILTLSDSSPQREKPGEVLWNSTSTIDSPKTSLKEKRTKSADQPRKDGPRTLVLRKGKSASPRKDDGSKIS